MVSGLRWVNKSTSLENRCKWLRIIPYFLQPILCKLLFFLHRILQERTGSQEVRGLNNLSSANEIIGKVLRRKPVDHFNDLANSCHYWGESGVLGAFGG